MNFSVCVFCGSRDGESKQYRELATAFGQHLAKREMTLVYGGGNVGLMGALADAALAGGGEVVGVIPGFLSDREVAHNGLSELHVVDDLLERKALMIERADAFVALPGGVGTYDELFEVLSWRQLRQLRQPIGLLNTGDFFSPLLQLLEHSTSAGFISRKDIEHIVVETDPVQLLDALL